MSKSKMVQRNLQLEQQRKQIEEKLQKLKDKEKEKKIVTISSSDGCNEKKEIPAPPKVVEKKKNTALFSRMLSQFNKTSQPSQNTKNLQTSSCFHGDESSSDESSESETKTSSIKAKINQTCSSASVVSSQLVTSNKKSKKRKNRWGEKIDLAGVAPPGYAQIPGINPVATPTSVSLGLAQRSVGLAAVNQLSEEQKKQLEEQKEMQVMYNMIMASRNALIQQPPQMLQQQTSSTKKNKYAYDSDEEIDDAEGTWEHQQRRLEMSKTQVLAEKLTDSGQGKHFIGDFLPPEELEKFMETFKALKDGRTPDYSDYKEFKIQCDNIGFKMLEKMGWKEGEGLGCDNKGITAPVNKGKRSLDRSGVGNESADSLSRDDDDFSAYRKRMMLAYRFRPNPLNNPRRPYY